MSLSERNSPRAPEPLKRALSATSLTVEEMYKIATRQNTVWGIPGYEVPREYIDPKLLKEIRENKLKKPAPKATRRGHYLEDELKLRKGMPGPIYGQLKPWFDDKAKKAKIKYGNKKTFIDEIFREATIRKFPGPGAYNLRKTDEEVEKARKKMKSLKKGDGERMNFLMEVEYISVAIPGPGMYNPRTILPKLHINKSKPEDIKKKHAEELKKHMKSAPDLKAPLLHPFPATYDTFGKYLKMKEDKKEPRKIKYLGTEQRFKKVKKDDPNNFPGPIYNTVAVWKGKPEHGKKADKKETDWMKKVTKGPERSIYY